jgi:LmbE family N-acetylglucosaminyl deacetylase
MHRLDLNLSRTSRFRILCLGSHSDDIEIGCGGTLLRLSREYGSKLEVWWTVFSANGVRKSEAQEAAERILSGSSQKQILLHAFRDGFFPSQWGEIKEVFEGIKSRFSPDLVLTHTREDRHQDHRTIADLTWNTFRDHLILEYEIPKYDGDFGSPNVFIPLEESICRQKSSIILECFNSQSTKHWLTEDLLLGLMRLRGMESASPSRFAEAFYARKVIL